MRTNIIKLFSVLTFLTCFFTKVGAQTKLTGKTYVAEVGATCKDGVGMIWTYRILDFKKDSVVVSYRVKENIIPERKGMYEHMYDNLKKTYKWKNNNKIVSIENCKEFSKLTIQKSKLIGQDSEMKPIVFEEEP